MRFPLFDIFVLDLRRSPGHFLFAAGFVAFFGTFSLCGEWLYIITSEQPECGHVVDPVCV